jgi:orotate phosphoribosyltransferase
MNENYKTGTENDVAKALLNIKAVTLRTNPPYEWASGIKSPIYTDNRLLISHIAERKTVIDAFIKIIKEKGIEFDVVAGTALGGVPHAAWIAWALGKPMVMIRKEEKGHGKQNRIEGDMKPGDRVLVIEDLISTGGSSISAIDGVKERGGAVSDCIAIFTYEFPAAAQAFNDAGVKLHTLTTFSCLLKVAKETKYISHSDEAKILDFKDDPKGWWDRIQEKKVGR